MPPGRIFIFSDEADDRRVKISNAKPAGLGLQNRATESGADGQPILRYEAFVSNIAETERALRVALRNHRVRGSLEWYNIEVDYAISLVEEAEKTLSNAGVLTFIHYERPPVRPKVAAIESIRATRGRSPARQAARKAEAIAPEADVAKLSGVNKADVSASDDEIPQPASPQPATTVETPPRERTARVPGAVGEKDIQFVGFLLRARRDAIFRVMVNHIINCVFWAALAAFVAIVSIRSADKITPSQSSIKVLIGANFILIGFFIFIVWRELRAMWRAVSAPIEIYGVWHFKWLSLSAQMGTRNAADLALRLYDELSKAQRKTLIYQHFTETPRRSKPEMAADFINMPGKKRP